MTHVIRISLAFLTSAVLVRCAHEGPGLRVMNERSEYQDEAAETTELNLGSTNSLNETGNIRARPEPRVAMVWIHPQRISQREHFWGAWVSLRLEDENWESATTDQYEPEPSSKKPKDGVMNRKTKKSE